MCAPEPVRPPGPVEVAGTGDDESQVGGKAAKGGHLGGAVVGVVDLDPVEAGRGQRFDRRRADDDPPPGREGMGEHTDTSCGPHHVHGREYVVSSLPTQYRPRVAIQSAVKAVPTSGMIPSSTMARAMCGRPTVPPPAISRTRS